MATTAPGRRASHRASPHAARGARRTSTCQHGWSPVLGSLYECWPCRTAHRCNSSMAATALSSSEAELYAFTFLVRLLLAQRNLATFITGTTLPASVVLCDNMSVSCSILTVVPNEDHTRPLARSTAAAATTKTYYIGLGSAPPYLVD